MFQRSPTLWHINNSKRAETTSVSRDLFLENGAEGTPGPVTACHIKTGGWRWERKRVLSGLIAFFDLGVSDSPAAVWPCDEIRQFEAA